VNVNQALKELSAFNIGDDNYMERLYEITDALEGETDNGTCADALYSLLERYPDVDFGSPGPIVHNLERNRFHRDKLPISVQRQPGYLNVWMVNRILNDNLSDAERMHWTHALADVVDNPKAADNIKGKAKKYLVFQQAKDST
jgi:hypothetical protein